MSARAVVAVLVAILVNGPAGAQQVVRGTITNGTTGAPGRAERVGLVSLSGGMAEVEHLTDVAGEFRLDIEQPGPYLVQVHYQGVQYTQRVTPGAAEVELRFTTFETTDDASAIQVAIPHRIVIVDGPKLHVSRVFEIRNTTDPPRTIVGRPGAFRFDMPDDATLSSAAVTSQGMPLRMEPVESSDDRGQTFAYPLKPGITRYEIEHQMPYAGSIELRETLYHGAVVVNTIVLPASVEVEAPGLEAKGATERQGVSFLTFVGQDLPPGQVLQLRIRGEAVAPRVPGAEAAGDGAPAAGGAPRAAAAEGEVKVVENRTGRGLRKFGVLGALVAIFGLALATMARATPPSAAPRRRTGARVERLLDDLAALDDRRGRCELDDAAHGQQRAELKRALVQALGEVRRQTPA